MPADTTKPTSRNNPPVRKRKRVTKRQAYRRRMIAMVILLILIIILFRACAVSCSKIKSSNTISTIDIEQSTDNTSATSVTYETDITYMTDNNISTEIENNDTNNTLTTSIENNNNVDDDNNNNDNSNNKNITTELNTSTSEREYLVDHVPDAYKIDMEVVLQNPELPTGCEITSLTMVLNYLGFGVTKTELVDGYLTCKDPGTATFKEAFIGSPYDPSSYGCFAPVIIDTANKYLKANDSGRIVKNLTGSDFDFLLREVASNHPVIIWTSINQIDVYEDYAFTIPDENTQITEDSTVNNEIEYDSENIKRNDENYASGSVGDGTILDDQSEYVFDDSQENLNTNGTLQNNLEQGSINGKDVYWIVNEHCVVLMGYDSVNNNVIVADPLEGEIVYDMTRFKKLYQDLYKQAVIIY